MKKRLVSLALVCVMLVSTVLLTSCGGETSMQEIEAKIYTIYTICGEGTTAESIHEVELALNRLTFYQLDYCVKLIMVTEDEYDQLISGKLAECEELKIASSAKPSKSSAAESAASAVSAVPEKEVFTFVPLDSTKEPVEVEGILTGDEYIDMLAAGYEYELAEPRVDIFLVEGYDNYIELVGKEKLSALDDKLSGEAKLIRDFIFPTFLEAAKVTNVKGTRKTYGIPMNKGIGQYDYIVFDKEYLDKYETDAVTMTNLEDLEFYLKKIAANEPGVVPLANVFDSPEFAYLFEDGFAAYINEGTTVVDTYTNKAALEYFTLISRYRSMGYIKEAGDNDRWAVKFIRGTHADLEALEAKTGHEYDFTVHSYPVATNEDLLSSLFCISAYTIADELTDVAKILEFIETNTDAANLLAYGIEGINYTLNENNQLVKINNDYSVKLSHAGNSFLTHTLAGENPDKWKLLMQQNSDSDKSADQAVSIGFAYYPVSIANPNDKNVVYSEPNYVSIIKQYCAEFYPDVINGTILDLTYDQIKDYVAPTISESLTASITDKYTALLQETIRAEIAVNYDKGSDWYDRVLHQTNGAYDRAVKKYTTTSTKRNIRTLLRAEIVARPENAGKSDEEIDAILTAECTDEYLAEQILEVYAAEIEKEMYRIADSSRDAKINSDYKTYVASDEYLSRLETTLNSGECLAEKEAILGDDLFEAHYDLCLEKINEYLTGLISGKVTTFMEGLNVALRSAYREFQDSYLANFPFDDLKKRSEPDYRNAITYVFNKAAEGRTTMSSVLQTELRSIVIAELGEDELPQNITDEVNDRFTPAWIQDVVIETFNYAKDQSIECKVSTPALRDIVNRFMTVSQVEKMYYDVILLSFEKSIGLIKTIEVDTGAAEKPEEPTEEDPEEDEEEKIVTIDTADLYTIIFEKRIQDQYYDYKPLPTA